jgi:hypothetical protein
MGYTTDFSGTFNLNRELSPKMAQYLTLFNETRRMKRNVEDVFGIQGEFFVFGGGSYGQDHESNVIDYNGAPSTQPGLWCQWVPTSDRMAIEHDGGEKFYNYVEWIVYLINKVLAPNGYVLNGSVDWEGEDRYDVGTITIIDNRVFIDEGGEVLPKGNVRTDIVLILDNESGVNLDFTNMRLLEK